MKINESQIRIKRDALINWTRTQLIGGERDFLVGKDPLKAFQTAYLFPQTEKEQIDDDDELAMDNDDENNVSAANIKTKRFLPPSSVGFSFYVERLTPDTPVVVRIEYAANRYELQKNRDASGQFIQESKRIWKKKVLIEQSGINEVEIHSPPSIKGSHSEQISVLDNEARIDSIWRKSGEGFIVTVSLSNSKKHDSAQNKPQREVTLQENEDTLFQVMLKCYVDIGKLQNYPESTGISLSEEEKQLKLRYKDIHVYGIGHGASVDWQEDTEHPKQIWSEFLPQVEVPQVTTVIQKLDQNVLNFEFLSDPSKKAEVMDSLLTFIQGYKDWISEQRNCNKLSSEDEILTAEDILSKASTAQNRMLKGVSTLQHDVKAWKAFSLMNQAMLMQMRGMNKSRETTYCWRPFQLAFVLMTIDSLIDNNSEFRDIVDLIWFPTGGGKTEAYLGAMAFLAVYRRLRYPSSGHGTAVIMRYTLRLLTAQQFIRASKIICALELIRVSNTQELGEEKFSIGLWVGGATSPNTFKQAIEAANKNEYTKFVLDECPWCGCKLVPNSFSVNENSASISCLNNDCDVNALGSLPVQVVDDALYKRPTTFLITTIDKFARLIWEEKTNHFFDYKACRPPELIVQDELHLISGEIGSIAGIYEVAIDTILKAKDIYPKYIASTATIRNAAEQVQAMLGRDMAIFPPPGIRMDDSYFAKTVPTSEKIGRTYVGFLAPVLPKNISLAPLAGALLAAPEVLFKNDDIFEDAWWTQLVYHGSLKGVSNSYTLFNETAYDYYRSCKELAFVKELAEETNQLESNPSILSYLLGPSVKQYNSGYKPESMSYRALHQMSEDEAMKTVEGSGEDNSIKEIFKKYIPSRKLQIGSLTSKITAGEISEIFNQLSKHKSDKDSLDVALATNMVSVGLDVGRLALMIINGQPLTTAEYIQASSRVGRAEVPGVVFTNYHRSQARSLSHYENFKAYHQSFYRYVEPSSLTPFTFQVRQRALHASLIIALRHSVSNLLTNSGASEFTQEDSQVKAVVEIFKKRMKQALLNLQQFHAIEDNIDKILNEWESEIKNNPKRKVVYFSNDKGTENLIFPIQDTFSNKIPWATLNSMRNVEKEALLSVLRGVNQIG